MLTLRDLMGELELDLVAGDGDAIQRPVRWVHISELADPTPWLSGGELLLTTGLRLGGDSEQRDYVARLAGHGLAGLGFGVGFGFDTVPAALCEAATELGFPVYAVPYDVPFIAVTEKASSWLVNEHYAVLQRALAAHERLEQTVLSERGLPGVIGALAALLEGSAAVFDPGGRVLARRDGGVEPPAAALAALGAELAARAGERPDRAWTPAGWEDGCALVLPVARSGPAADAAPQAWLVAIKDAGRLTESDRLVLHHGATVVALELLHRRVAEDTERRLAGDVLAGIVGGELSGPELERRLVPFGVGRRAGVLVLAPPRAMRPAAESALARAVREEPGGGVVAVAAGVLCALLGADEDEDALFAQADRLRAHVSAAIDTPLAGGAGRPVLVGDARRAILEARCALDAHALGGDSDLDDPSAGGSGGRGRSRLVTFRDLGSFQLLLSLQDDDALRLFCDSVLAPIENGEGAYGGELMRSLEVFIECNGQWERAAKRLFCHRHTLRYRIRRVEELTGRSLDTARDRIDFWLALRGRDLIQPRERIT